MAPRTKAKLEDFLTKLESRRYIVEPVSKKPQVYRIDGELVNIRSKGRSQHVSYGEKFLYSITFSVLQDVKWVIYLITSDQFVMFPSSFLSGLKDSMYPDSKNANVGIFDIDSTNELIVLKNGELKPIGEYYYDLSYLNYPDF